MKYAILAGKNRCDSMHLIFKLQLKYCLLLSTVGQIIVYNLKPNILYIVYNQLRSQVDIYINFLSFIITTDHFLS